MKKINQKSNGFSLNIIADHIFAVTEKKSQEDETRVYFTEIVDGEEKAYAVIETNKFNVPLEFRDTFCSWRDVYIKTIFATEINKGYGSKLLSQILDRYKNYENIYLIMSKLNQATNLEKLEKFYKTFGFEKCDCDIRWGELMVYKNK